MFGGSKHNRPTEKQKMYLAKPQDTRMQKQLGIG